MKTNESSKSGLGTTLSVDVGALLFGITCILLASVLFTAKMMTDEIVSVEDEGYKVTALPNPVFL